MYPSISLYVFKSRVNKRGDTNIYIRFTSNRKSTYLSTGIAIPYNQWDKVKNKAKSGYRLANQTNMLLEKRVLEVREQLMVSAIQNRQISSKQAKRTVTGKGQLSFFTLADEYLKNFIREDKIGSADKVRSIIAKFREFMGGSGATFYDIDEKVITEFQHFLREKHKNKVNTIHSNLKTIRTIFNMAVKKGIITSESDPFNKFTLKKEKTTRPFLLEEEFRALANVKLEPGSLLEKCRDMFIWTTLAGGLRITDVLSLKKSNIRNEYLDIIIQKTGTPHHIKVPLLALEIQNKYAARIKEEDGFVFGMLPINYDKLDPIGKDKAITIATAVYNKYLKIVGEKAGINKKLSSHIARITFITLAVNMGIDLRTIQGVVKHADIAMTAHYSKLVDNSINEALVTFQQEIDLKKDDSQRNNGK